MKELIKNSGLTIKEFAEEYKIPYNTVRQWANSEREAPAYIKNLIEENRNLKTKGEQLQIPYFNENEEEYNVIERVFTDTGMISREIYGKENAAIYNADINFLIQEDKKGYKYTPKWETYKVRKIH